MTMIPVDTLLEKKLSAEFDDGFTGLGTPETLQKVPCVHHARDQDKD